MLSCSKWKINCMVLGEDVRGVLLTRPLGQDKISRADALLHPRLGNRQMADSSDAGTTAYADSRAA
eukprot:3845698-Alexandrium_andersonii.AAC.1